MRTATMALLCLLLVTLLPTTLLPVRAAPTADTEPLPWVPLRVQRVVVVNKAPAVLLVDEAHRRYLLLYVDLFMASAIRLGMDGVHLERPLTHDLMETLLRRLGARLTRIVITELRDNTYYARIGMEINGEATSIDARPSDAIALAVRAHAPVFAAEELLTPLEERAPEDAETPEGPGSSRSPGRPAPPPAGGEATQRRT